MHTIRMRGIERLAGRRLYAWKLCIAAAFLYLYLYPVAGAAQMTGSREASEFSLHPYRDADTAGILRDIIHADSLVKGSSHIDQAMRILKATARRSALCGYNYGVARSFFHLGYCYEKKGDYRQAILSFRKCLRYAMPVKGAYVNIPNVYNSLANIYYTIGQYDTAAGIYYKVLSLPATVRSRRVTAGVYNNLGIIFGEFGRPEQALSYLNQAEEVAGKEKDYDLLARIFFNKSTIYEQAGDSLRKDYCLQTALSFARGGKHDATRRFILKNTGHMYLGQKQYARAREYLQKALRAEKEMAPQHTNAIYLELAEACIGLSDYKAAEDYLLRARANCRTYQISEGMAGLEQLLSETYRSTGRYEEALAHHYEYTRLKDSLQQGAAAQAISRLDMKYHAAEKEKDLAKKQLLINEQKRKLDQKNMWIVGACSGIGMLGMMLLGVYRNYQHRQRLHAGQLRTLKQETEIALLQAMMKGEEKQRVRIARELHDGISSQLSVIKMFIGAIRKNNPDVTVSGDLRQAMHMLTEMSEEVRKTAHNLMPDGLIRQGLAEATRSFCEQISKGLHLRIELQVYGDLSGLDHNFTLLVYRTIQELVHNIVKHAHATQAIVLLTTQDDVLYITIEDNGVGMIQFPAGEGQEGVGMTSLQRRVRAMDGHMIVESHPGKGTTVYIELPGMRKKKPLSANLIL